MSELKDQTLRETGSLDAASYFSGQSGSSHNNPIIIAYLRGDTHYLVVMARGVRREFPISEFDKATEWYKMALGENGYGEDDDGDEQQDTVDD